MDGMMAGAPGTDGAGAQTPEAAQARHAAALLAEMGELLAQVRRDGAATLAGWGPRLERRRFRLSAGNFARYLALRHHDLRPLQTALMPLGLSSLGRCEGRVEETLSAVILALAALAGQGMAPAGAGPAAPPAGVRAPGARRYFRGERWLRANTARLFGPRPDPAHDPGPAGRQVRILVTLPPEAATDPALLHDLVAAGTDAVRINCAHDGQAAWAAMIANLRAAEAACGRRVAVLMDLAGPKVRTGAVLAARKRVRLGERILLTRAAPEARADAPFQAQCSIPAILDRVRVGQPVFIDDGKLGGTVETVDAAGVWLRLTRAGPEGEKLKPEKGLNFPETDLGLAALTEEDRRDLDFVAAQADLIGYSFVQSPADVAELQAELERRRPLDWRQLGLIAKIETPKAVRNLPGIIVAAAGRQPFGLMIARGDLAVELGFERTAEMQEEMLWLAEAAHVPVIWATQVLETLVKKGLPTRGEMTDAFMAGRADCVMLNKGPRVVDAVQALDRLLSRLAENQVKKTPKLRALRSW
ncbi:pyruvate kinase [Oleisolibacter albus]|uniref:pyruvate kinase n=1 Tax=Oleisolibacter albus TaxID=2171757 RepID=UPI001EFD0526|nr:pyruvate kinase [Oleisolibacter albus]